MKTLILIALLILSILGAKSQTKVAITAVPEVQQQFWNGFVDFVAVKGYYKSDELDRRDKTISSDLWSDYNEACHTTYDYTSFVKMVQIEILNYREQSLALIHSGRAKFDGDDGDFMANLSKPDGWAGSKTTSWKFPYVRSRTIMVSNGNQIAQVKN